MKRVLITGAGSGLGRGLALRYARAGADVALVGRRLDVLQEVSLDVERAGGRARVFALDVTDLASVESAVSLFVEEAGGIDVAIANAGIGEPDDTKRLDPASAARVLRTNVIGVSNTLLSCVPVMQQQGAGTLVGMASVAAFRALPGSLSYSTSKAAVLTLMEGLELELAGSGVQTVTLCPGFVRTPLTDRNDFPMPFLLNCEEACDRMFRAIERGARQYTFPLPMRIAALLLRHGPHWLLHAASPKSPKKKRRRPMP